MLIVLFFQNVTNEEIFVKSFVENTDNLASIFLSAPK